MCRVRGRVHTLHRRWRAVVTPNSCRLRKTFHRNGNETRRGVTIPCKGVHSIKMQLYLLASIIILNEHSYASCFFFLFEEIRRKIRRLAPKYHDPTPTLFFLDLHSPSQASMPHRGLRSSNVQQHFALSKSIFHFVLEL